MKIELTDLISSKSQELETYLNEGIVEEFNHQLSKQGNKYVLLTEEVYNVQGGMVLHKLFTDGYEPAKALSDIKALYMDDNEQPDFIDLKLINVMTLHAIYYQLKYNQ